MCQKQRFLLLFNKKYDFDVFIVTIIYPEHQSTMTFVIFNIYMKKYIVWFDTLSYKSRL